MAGRVARRRDQREAAVAENVTVAFELGHLMLGLKRGVLFGPGQSYSAFCT